MLSSRNRPNKLEATEARAWNVFYNAQAEGLDQDTQDLLKSAAEAASQRNDEIQEFIEAHKN